MTVEELKTHLRQFAKLMDLPRRDLNPAELALCVANLNMALQDEATPIPAEVFADLNDDCRRFALSGLLILTGLATS